MITNTYLKTDLCPSVCCSSLHCHHVITLCHFSCLSGKLIIKISTPEQIFKKLISLFSPLLLDHHFSLYQLNVCLVSFPNILTFYVPERQHPLHQNAAVLYTQVSAKVLLINKTISLQTLLNTAKLLSKYYRFFFIDKSLLIAFFSLICMYLFL